MIGWTVISILIAFYMAHCIYLLYYEFKRPDVFASRGIPPGALVKANPNFLKRAP